MFASLVSWWYWPRGDARFVGKWSAGAPGGPLEVMTLHRNGSGTTVVTGLLHVTFTWRVADNRLIIGRPFSPSIQPTVQWLADHWLSLTGRMFMVGEQSIELVKVSPEAIHFRRPGEAGGVPTPEDEVLIMTRLPE
ncbi:hypothetical protein AYO47_03465 [Planctomyces sp. SCGC AG-212-M04]|nr:hypothetical protein AYO47_03465 [Planctomyces sp. SCGC AG-212-M04]